MRSPEALGHEVCREIIPEALEKERQLLNCLTPAEEVAFRSIPAKLHTYTDGITFEDT
jgi:hypothetical protein